MKTVEVYLGGNYGKDGIAMVYGLTVYFGHKDPRNISWKCSSTVKDVNGAELEALVYFLEWCSTHDHNEPCNFAVRTSSSALITWILVHLPTYKEYGWTHTEQDESIPYEEILRYVDALLDQIPIHPQSPKLSFSLIPAHAVVDGNGHALKLAKKAVAVDTAVKSRDWEALTYVARVDIVHTITSPGFSSSAKEMEDAMLKTQQARMRFEARKETLPQPVEHTVPRCSNVKAEQSEVISIDTDEEDEEEEGHHANTNIRIESELNLPPRSGRGSTTGNRTSGVIGFPALVRSSKQWEESGIPKHDLRVIFARLCEQAIPNFIQSQAKWPRISMDLRYQIWDRLLNLSQSSTAKTGKKRKINSKKSSNRPAKMQKTSAHSKQPVWASDIALWDNIAVPPGNFTTTLCNEPKINTIGLIVVFTDDGRRDLKYTKLDHIPHLVAAVNESGKRRVTLVTLPTHLLNSYTEQMTKAIAKKMKCFALHRSSYEHDEELLELLRKVPQPCNPVAS